MTAPAIEIAAQDGVTISSTQVVVTKLPLIDRLLIWGMSLMIIGFGLIIVGYGAWNGSTIDKALGFIICLMGFGLAEHITHHGH